MMKLTNIIEGKNWMYCSFDDGMGFEFAFHEKTKDFPEHMSLSYQWNRPMTYLNINRIIESLEYLNDNPIHEWKFDNKIIGEFITKNVNNFIRKVEFNDVYKDNYGYHYTWHEPEEIDYFTGEEVISVELKEPQYELNLDHWVMKLENIHKYSLGRLDEDRTWPGVFIRFRIEHK